MPLYVGAYSDAGRRRRVDQDACCLMEAVTPLGSVFMGIVCDGVGGLARGELASATLIRRFADWIEDKLPKCITSTVNEENLWNQISIEWDTLLRDANNDIHQNGTLEFKGLGTTFTGMLVIQNRYIVGHIGDCRLYEIIQTQNGAICTQLTKDQTIVSRGVEEGTITPEEAINHPQRNVILQAVGSQERIDPVYLYGDFHKGSTYLICCDGFYTKLAAQEIGAALNPSLIMKYGEQLLGDNCEQLATLAMDRGETDNLTAIAFIEATSLPSDASKNESPAMVAIGGDK